MPPRGLTAPLPRLTLKTDVEGLGQDSTAFAVTGKDKKELVKHLVKLWPFKTFILKFYTCPAPPPPSTPSHYFSTTHTTTPPAPFFPTPSPTGDPAALLCPCLPLPHACPAHCCPPLHHSLSLSLICSVCMVVRLLFWQQLAWALGWDRGGGT